jgi:hypothetical protein
MPTNADVSSNSWIMFSPFSYKCMEDEALSKQRYEVNRIFLVPKDVLARWHSENKKYHA